MPFHWRQTPLPRIQARPARRSTIGASGGPTGITPPFLFASLNARGTPPRELVGPIPRQPGSAHRHRMFVRLRGRRLPCGCSCRGRGGRSAEMPARNSPFENLPQGKREFRQTRRTDRIVETDHVPAARTIGFVERDDFEPLLGLVIAPAFAYAIRGK